MTMKRSIWFVLLTLCLLPLCLVACGDKATEGLEYERQDNGTYYVGAGEAQEMERIVIPKWHKGRKVTGIMDGGFASCSNLVEIDIPNSVKVIGYKGFFDCRALASIEIPKSVRKLEAMAFLRCRSLETVVFKGNATEIDHSVFIFCSSLTNVVLPKHLQTIPYWTFDGCTALKEITLPQNLHEISSQAFRDCSSLTSISIPASVAWIAPDAFDGCNSLAEAHFDGPETIPAGLMKNMQSLTTLSFGDGVKSIMDSAFWKCEALTSVTLPDGIERIAGNAFQSCYSIPLSTYGNGFYIGSKKNPYLFLVSPRSSVATEYEIHPDTKIIGALAFHDCNYFTSITLPDGIRCVEGSFLTYCAKLTFNEYDGGLYLGTRDNPYYYFYTVKDKDSTSINIHSKTVVLGPSTLTLCKQMTEINIPASVTSIKHGALLNSSSAPLANINVDPKNKVYASVDGVLYSKDKRVLIAFPRGKQVDTFTVPKSVTTIEASAFANNSHLTEVIISKGVTVLEENAFRWCKKLKKITLPRALTYIGYAAFDDCDELETVVYQGTEKQWEAVKVAPENYRLTGADFTYND